MKKILALIPFFIIAFTFLMGCQGTPEKQAVVQKDQEQMIEKAKATSEASNMPGMTLRKKTQAPETLKDHMTKDNMALSVDTRVDVPDCAEMDIMNVQEGNFSQKQITALWQELVGDTQMFQTSVEMTKPEIQASIIFAKGKLQKSKSDEDKKSWEKQIDYFNGAYANAPEKHIQTPANGQLQNLFVSTHGSDEKTPYTGIIAASKDGTVQFNVHNSYENGNGEPTPAAFEFSKGLDPASRQEGEPHVDAYGVNLEEKFVPDHAHGLKLSPNDAKVKVESFLSAANLPFMVRSATLNNSSGRTDSYYNFSFVRVIGNVPCAQILGETYEKNDETGYTKTWRYEDLFIRIDDSGIIGVTWEYPIETTGTVVHNSALKSFTDIQSIFNKMMFVTYAYQAKGVKALTCNITDIKLEMMRINEQNAQKAGLMVPVWDFYGVRTTQNSDGISTKTSKIILMTVNAVDGSIIDVSKGY